MPRPRKNPLPQVAAGPVEPATTTTAPGSVAATLPIVDEFGLPPRKTADGSPNAEYYVSFYDLVNRLMLKSITADGGKIPFNYEAALAGIDKQAKSDGFDPKTLRDIRTDAQIYEDATRRMCEQPEEIWAPIDREAEIVEKQMNRADDGSNTYLRGRLVNQTPKVWRDRLARIRRLRERCLKPTSKTQIRELTKRQIANLSVDEDLGNAILEAAWPLRVMVYCGRTNIADRLKGEPADAIYDVSHHHCKAAVDYWKARHRVAYRVVHDPTLGDLSTRAIVRGVSNSKVCILVIPFGHGKTDMGRFFTACEFVNNPKTQAGLNHAASEKAQETLRYLASLFSRGTPIGRRFVSLFGLETEQDNAKGFRIAMPDRLRSPSAWAAGVKSKVLGGNTSFQWWDDPVPMSDAEQETERKRTFQLLNGQWASRQRGENWFTLVTATLWHNDDAIAAMVKLARDKKVDYVVSIQSCGGPKSTPEFKSLWPEVMPSLELKARYRQMRNPSLYSAAYMSDPRSDSSRIVKKLRLYDPSLDAHKTFLANCVRYRSLDPSATVGRKSDLAGVLDAGFGDIQTIRTEDEQPIYSTEKRIRIITSESIPATQSDLVQHTANAALHTTIDYVLIEARSGFIGTCEMFENQFGITPIRFDPKNKNKEERLRAAAPAIENANADLGLHAVVEFPGVRTGRILHDGSPELAIDPRVAQLAEEVLDFGVCGTDHEIDTLSQLVIYLSPELGIGTGGIVSKAVTEQARMASDPRLQRLLNDWERKKDRVPVTQEENEFLTGQNGSWKMPERTDGPGGW